MTEKIYVDDKLEEGYIHVRTIIEMVGKPKEHLVSTLKDYVKKLAEFDQYIILSEDFADPAENEGGMFNAFVELELLVKSSEDLAWFCFDYLPASVEVIEPTGIKYKGNEFTNFLNDLLGRLHSLDMNFKTFKSQNDMLNRNSEAILKNLINYALKSGPKTLNQLAGISGLKDSNMKNILDVLEKNKLVKLNGDKYSL